VQSRDTAWESMPATAAAGGNGLRAAKRLRLNRRSSGPASPPEPTASRAELEIQRQLRDAQATKQSKAKELSTLPREGTRAQFLARYTALEGDLELLAKEKILLRAQVATVQNSTRCDLLQLPAEVRQQLIEMVDIEALGRLAMACKELQHSTSDPVIWRMKASTASVKSLCQLLVRMCGTGGDAKMATICCQRVRTICDAGIGKTWTGRAPVSDEAKAFNSAGGARAIMVAMGSHAADAKLQAEACHVLTILARGPEGKAVVQAAGGAQAFVRAMRAHGGAANVQGCRGVAQLAYSSKGREAMVAAGGAEAVVGAMQAHVGVVAVQVKGCAAISSLALIDEGSAALVAAGGAEAVVGALRAHPSVVAVQAKGCAAMTLLSFSDEGSAALVTVGGAEAVVGALRAHPSVIAVQAKGCAAISSLALIDEGSAALVALGGAEAVVGALRAHPSVIAVQDAGCAAMLSLALNDEAIAALRQGGAEQLALDAARNHPTHEGVQENSGYLLEVFAM
jgi:hypothetical protein